MLQISSTHSSKFFRIFIRCVNLILVVCMVVSVLALADRATRPIYSQKRFGEFFENDQEYDVLFFGSSHMLHSINPMQLWEEHGITSYNWAGYATWPPASYWIFKNAIEYHKPKVAVLEVFAAANSMETQTYSMLHYTYDAFPLTQTKIQAVLDLYPQRDIAEELLVPLNVYHGKWSNLNIQTIQDAYRESWPSYNKGSEYFYEIYDEIENNDFEYLNYFSLEKEELRDSQQYIIKFIETCYEEGIQPVLLYVPYNVIVDSVDRITDLSLHYNVPFFDYYVNGNQTICQQTDLKDRAHLNFSGATKITKLFGQELAKLVDTEHTPAVDSKWESYYQDYKYHLRSELETNKSLSKSLLCLTDPSLSASITVNEKIFEHSAYKALLEQLQEKCEITVDSSVPYINLTILDAQTGETLFDQEYTS